MPASTPTIKTETLRELIAAGSVRSATVLGQRGGFAVLIRAGVQERILATKHGDIKIFSRLDTAANQLRAMGLAEFAVNVTNFEPGRLRPARPDRASALTRAHAVAAHDTWFRAEVQKTLDRIAQGEGEYIEHDALFRDLETAAVAATGKA